jgi:hypothetical protein
MIVIPVKKEIIWEIGGRKVKAELDNFVKISDTKYEIRDIKTCANVENIKPLQYYLTQATVYHMAVMEHLEADWNNIEIDIIYEFVDKRTPSRSRAIRFSNHHIVYNRGDVLDTIQRIITAEKTGIFIPSDNQITLWNNDYYGHEGYGRVTQLELI